MNYHAPAPRKLPASHAMASVFFPTTSPGFVDEFLGNYALPARTFDFTAEQIRHPGYLDCEQLRHERHTIVTFDQAHLDTLEISHVSQRQLEPEYQTYIINFNCNFKAWEQSLCEMQNNARDLQTNVIGFNYRGVSLSKGHASSMWHLIIDGIAQVQRLLDRGVSPENITLNGLSVGGAVATHVAWYFHQQDKRLNLFNDRSFASTLVLTLSHTQNIPLIGGLMGLFFSWLIGKSAWDFSSVELFQEIPEEYREYMLVRTAKASRTSETKDDQSIPHSSSLHFAFKEQRRQQSQAIDAQIAKLRQEEPVDVTTIEMLHHQQYVEKEKAKSRKMEVIVSKVGTDEAHTLPKKYLHNRQGTSGDTFFKAFVQKAHDEHGVKPMLNSN